MSVIYFKRVSKRLNLYNLKNRITYSAVRKAIIFLLLVICGFRTYSLNKTDSVYIDSVYNLGLNQIPNGYDSINKYTELLFNFGNSKKVDFALGNAYTILSRYYHSINEYDTALIYIDSAITNFDIVQDASQLGVALYSKGILGSAKGDFRLATEYLMLAIQNSVDKEANFLKSIAAMSRIELGKIFYYQGAYEESTMQAKEAQKYYESAEKSPSTLNGLINCHTLIGNNLKAQENPKCKDSFYKALELSIELNDSNSIAIAEINLGTFYLESDSIDKAEKFMFNSYAYFVAHNLIHLLGPSTINLGQFYFIKKDFAKSKEYCLKGVELAKEMNQHGFCVIGYKNLKNIYQRFGDKDSALFALEQVVKYTNLQKDESILQERERLLVKFETQLKELENEKLLEENEIKAQQIEQQRKYNIQLCFAISFLIIALVVLFFMNKKNRKISRELEIKNNELHDLNVKKNEILSIISHDLRAPIAQIYSLHKEQVSGDFTPDEAAYIQTSIGQSVENGLQMLENILLWAKGYLRGENVVNRVNVSELVSRVLKQVAHQAETKQITIINAVGPSHAMIAEELAEVIVRNVVSNAIKFTPLNGEIQLYFENKAGFIYLYFADNGVGMSQDLLNKINAGNFNQVKSNVGTLGEKGSGLGLQLCIDLAKRMSSDLYIERSSEEGTLMVLKMKAA